MRSLLNWIKKNKKEEKKTTNRKKLKMSWMGLEGEVSRDEQVNAYTAQK